MRFASLPKERFETLLKHREGWGAAPRYQAQIRPSFLGGRSRWVVNLNNHTDLADFGGDQRAAELDAARRNYEAGSYPFPTMFGQ